MADPVCVDCEPSQRVSVPSKVAAAGCEELYGPNHCEYGPNHCEYAQRDVDAQCDRRYEKVDACMRQNMGSIALCRESSVRCTRFLDGAECLRCLYILFSHPI